jgi:hypothetical protein
MEGPLHLGGDLLAFWLTKQVNGGICSIFTFFEIKGQILANNIVDCRLKVLDFILLKNSIIADLSNFFSTLIRREPFYETALAIPDMDYGRSQTRIVKWSNRVIYLEVRQHDFSVLSLRLGGTNQLTFDI